MVVNVEAIWQALFVELTRLIVVAKEGADKAHAAATDKEAIAENKYDTRGLEASYLAHGQQERMAQCLEDNALFDALYIKRESSPSQVALGAVVTLAKDDVIRYVLIGPSAGGIKLECSGIEVLVITPQSPLGALLMGKELDDEVKLIIGDNAVNYDIIAID